ncbi:MAG: ESPR domain-containing protein [Sutterella sp.]|nr:ESPR domain-containing protein [Sutterella sp.]
MNHVFKVVWNDVQCVWQCVSELTRSHSKKSQRERHERIASVQTQPTSFNQRAVMLALAAILGGVMVSPSALAATDGQNGTNQANVNYVVTRDDGNTTPEARAKFSAVYKQVNPKPGSYAADATDGSNGDAGLQGTDGAVNPANAKTDVSVSATIASGSITGYAGTSGGNGGMGSAGGNGGNGSNGAGHLDGSGQQKGYDNNTETNEIATAAALVGQPVLPDLVGYAPQNVNAWSGFVFHGGRGGNGGAGGTGGQGGAGGQGGQGQTGLWIHSGSYGPVTYTVSQGVVISGGAGGAGGTGGQGGQGGNGGNGGNGGVGANLNTDGSASAYTAMRDAGGLEGGKGGNAGKGGAGGAGGNGGNGGNGGVGVFVDGQTLVLAGTVNGGAGGAAGQAGQSGENGDHGTAGTGGKNGVLRITATAIYEGGNADNGTRPGDNDFNGTPTTTPTAGQEGRGGSAVLLDNQATLVLESGAQLIGGGTGNTQGKAIEAIGNDNTVQLNTELSNVTLTGGVSGSGTNLVLKGQDNTAYTITADQVASKFGSAFFYVLVKQGSSTWTVQGNLTPLIERVAEVNEGTLKFAANSAWTKNVFVNGSSTLVIDKAATVTHVVLDDSSTLETNLASLSNYTAQTLRTPGDNVTLKTTDNFTSSELVNTFHNWTVSSGISTAEGATQLAKGTTSLENGTTLTIKNVTLEDGQTIAKATGGTLYFEGENNFDEGTLTLEGAGAEFKSGAVLVTNKTSGADIQNNAFGKTATPGVAGKDVATLRTKGAFEAKEGFAHQFNKWEVQGTGSKATHADQLAKETDVQSNGGLTLTDVTLGEGQTLALSGGDLTFAGLTNLDQGTKSFTSGVYRFANEAVLETAKASLADVLVNVNAMEQSDGATLRTKGETFTSSNDVTKFGT